MGSLLRHVPVDGGAAALCGGDGDGRLRQHEHRLEGDGGGARVQGGFAGAEEGRGEGGGGGGASVADQRRESPRLGGEDRSLAPRRTQQWQFPAAVPVAGECQGGSGEGGHGKRRADGHRAEGGGEEAGGEGDRDLRVRFPSESRISLVSSDSFLGLHGKLTTPSRSSVNCRS